MHPQDAPTASDEAILREILDAMTALRNGHFTTHLPEGMRGLGGQIAHQFNQHIRMLQELKREHHRLMEEIGVTGRLGGQMVVEGTGGAWKDIVEDVNRMGGNVTGQFRDGGNVVRDLLRGELSSRMSARCIQGEFREFREHFNELAEHFEQRSAVAAS
ncbi:MAG TPA: hypothetical protein VH518_20345 [Tepidisphaeraceae bacterium]|jgi:osomolarity two-component system sensor histidine kinase NIK1